jgi:hypothetical protein
MARLARTGLLALGFLAASAWAGDNRFCGGPVVQSGEPTDLAHVVGDQTLEYLADQPASLMVCSKGYLLEKCGDHETARKVFDKCIAAGYIGAMIWKALMLQDGAGGVPPDLPAAAELMRRAASAGDSPYATLGKLHYASALHMGKGVPKDEAAARQWFEAAAADGDPDAIEFLRTGYHTGDRDGQTRGVGSLQPVPLPGELMEAQPVASRGVLPAPGGRMARRLDNAAPLAAPPEPAPSAGDPAEAVPVPPRGQHLARVEAPSLPVSALPLNLAALLLAAFLSGVLHQSLRGRRPALSGA